jgi:polar amino acid transport system substrate-binding protein
MFEHMLMNRRKFMKGAGVVATSAALAGCGSTTSSDAGGGSSSSGSSGSTTATTAEGYTLVEDGKLTLISNFAFPPFEFADENTGEYKGFDVDVANAIAGKLNLELNILPTVQFDTIVPTIKQGGKADISLAAITITDDRKKEAAFTEPYLDSNQSFVVKADATDKTIAALNVSGKKIAVQSGTTGEAWAQENMASATIVPLDDIVQAMSGVQTGLYDACVADLPVTSYMISQSYSDLMIPDGVYSTSSNPAGGQIPTGEQYGAILKQDNTALIDAVNDAFDDLWDEGTMDSIQTTWFGEVICSKPSE